MAQRSVAAAAQLSTVVVRAAARRRSHLLPLFAGALPRPTMLPRGADHQRASSRLGRLLTTLVPQAAAGSESVGAPPAAAQPAPAAPAAAPAPPPIASGYKMPPKEISDIVDAPPEPLLSFSPDRTLVLQVRCRRRHVQAVVWCAL